MQLAMRLDRYVKWTLKLSALNERVNDWTIFREINWY